MKRHSVATLSQSIIHETATRGKKEKLRKGFAENVLTIQNYKPHSLFTVTAYRKKMGTIELVIKNSLKRLLDYYLLNDWKDRRNTNLQKQKNMKKNYWQMNF